MDNIDVSNDVMLYIAEKIQSNIRELEGALIRVIAFASLNNKPITVQLAEEALKDILVVNKPRPITADLIQEKVASFLQ